MLSSCDSAESVRIDHIRVAEHHGQNDQRKQNEAAHPRERVSCPQAVDQFDDSGQIIEKAVSDAANLVMSPMRRSLGRPLREIHSDDHSPSAAG